MPIVQCSKVYCISIYTGWPSYYTKYTGYKIIPFIVVYNYRDAELITGNLIPRQTAALEQC